MINPAGQECRFYYQDYHRGRNEQTCRLIDGNPSSPNWQAKDCTNCPVPGILRANNSPELVLQATVKKGVLGLNRHVEVTAFCSRHLIDVPKPHVGCPECAKEKPGLQELFGNQP